MSAVPWFTPAEVERIRRLRTGGYNLREISERLGRPKSGIGKLIRRGYRRTVKCAENEAPPGDLSLQAAHLTLQQLARHYHVGTARVRTWLDQKGIVRPNMRYQAPQRPCPPDFVALACCMSLKRLRQHYSTGRGTITRWRMETGLLKPPAPAKPTVGWAERYHAERLAA